MRHTNRGNILFLILLAVVLFAALAYAVTQSMRGGGKDAGSERISAGVSELLNNYAQIDTAIQRLMLGNNVKAHEINLFDNNSATIGQYDNVNCTENRCRVYHPDGGGVTGRVSPAMLRKPGAMGQARIYDVIVPGAGTALPDLVMTFHGIKPEACKLVNQSFLNIDDALYNAPGAGTLLYYTSPYPSGPFSSSATMNVPQSAGIAGTFCTCIGADMATCDANALYPAINHVLIAR